MEHNTDKEHFDFVFNFKYLDESINIIKIKILERLPLESLKEKPKEIKFYYTLLACAITFYNKMDIIRNSNGEHKRFKNDIEFSANDLLEIFNKEHSLFQEKYFTDSISENIKLAVDKGLVTSYQNNRFGFTEKQYKNVLNLISNDEDTPQKFINLPK